MVSSLLTHLLYSCMQGLVSYTQSTNRLSLLHTFMCTHAFGANTLGLSALPFCSYVLLLVDYYYHSCTHEWS